MLPFQCTRPIRPIACPASTFKSWCTIALTIWRLFLSSWGRKLALDAVLADTGLTYWTLKCFTMSTSNSKFYNILYLVKEQRTLLLSAITLDWVELHKWLIPLWKAKKHLQNQTDMYFCWGTTQFFTIRDQIYVQERRLHLTALWVIVEQKCTSVQF